MISLYVPFKGSPECRNLRQSLPVNVEEIAAGRNLAAEIFVGQDNSPVHEVAEYGHELAVVARLEILPAEIIVLGLRGIGSEDIPHHILLARELVEEFVSPYRPVAGSGNLVSLEVEELIGRDIVREDVAVSIGLQH